MVTTRLNPYLSFRDDARRAMEFYHSVFGGELSMSTFADLHLSEDPAERDKIMHAQLESPGGLVLMASDTPDAMPHDGGGGFAVSLSGDDEAELCGYWAKLSEEGTVTQPLTVAPWGDKFGMCTDKFGVNWLVNITAQRA